MIRKYTEDKKLEKGEKVMQAVKTCTIRKDGEKALILKDTLYIVEGDYEDVFEDISHKTTSVSHEEEVTEPDEPVIEEE